jgi:hypothetical protein
MDLAFLAMSSSWTVRFDATEGMAKLSWSLQFNVNPGLIDLGPWFITLW